MIRFDEVNYLALLFKFVLSVRMNIITRIIMSELMEMRIKVSIYVQV